MLRYNDDENKVERAKAIKGALSTLNFSPEVVSELERLGILEELMPVYRMGNSLKWR